MIARHYETGQWSEITLRRGQIASVSAVEGPEQPGELDDWIAPAFWDVQTNGRWGVSFSDPGITANDVEEVVRAQAGLGTARLCPTLITASQANLLHGVRTIAEACDRSPEVEARVLGIHLKGPNLSERDGYRGAHPLHAIRDPDWDEFREIQEASGDRIVLVTLAPERSGAIAFIERLTAQGIIVALGHTAAETGTIHRAIEAGARLSTHLGNGIGSELSRHPNPIWDQAAADGLWASLIADGHHLGPEVLKVLVRAKTPERILLVSDANPLAGLPPGVHGAWEVHPSGKIVVAGTPYLAGSNRGIESGVNALIHGVGLTLAQAIDAATRQPARLLGRPDPIVGPGEPANLIRFRFWDQRFELMETCVGGTWSGPEAADQRIVTA